MIVRMLSTRRGSPDGIEIREYGTGQKYDLPTRLAEIFLSQGWAEEDKELVLETKSSEVKDEIEAEDGADGGAGKPRRGKGPFKGRRG